MLFIVVQVCTWHTHTQQGAHGNPIREKKAEVSETCAAELLDEMREGADDFRKDPRLHELCRDDAQSWCKDVEPKEGAVQDCLRQHRPRLSWDCQDELFRQDMENADDLRLSVKLFRKCLKDKRKVGVRLMQYKLFFSVS